MAPASAVKKTALITGAVSGIGNELSRLFAQDGYNLVLTDNDQYALGQLSNELEEKYKIYAKVSVKDFLSPSAPLELFDEIRQEQIRIDVLVNNALSINDGNFLETPIENDLNLIQMNISALTAITKLFTAEMVGLGGGKVLNITAASGSSFSASPSVYSASEAYILHFTQALSEELRNLGITVTLLCSGPVMYDKIISDQAGNNSFTKGKSLTAAYVAKEGYHALKNGKAIVIPGLQNKIAVYSSRYLPFKFSNKFSFTR